LTFLVLVLNRALRILPSYATAIFISYKIFPFLSLNLKNESESEIECIDYWWKNVLFIDDLDKNGTRCFGIAWYLSNDFQMFLGAPIIIIILLKSKKIGFSFIFILFVIFSLISTYIWHVN